MIRKINLTFPDGWENLSDAKLKFIFKLLSKNYSILDIIIIALFRWNKVRVLARKGDGSYILKSKLKDFNGLFEVSPLQLGECISLIDWIHDVPQYPVRVSRFGCVKALPADFMGVPFESFIIAENLYQGYMSTHQEDFLDQLAYILYPSRFNMLPSVSPWMRINVFYWFCSLKSFFSKKFSEFFVPAQPGSFPPSPEDAMNAQIRALTKGDVTKEKEILQLDTWRALEELNAQAREYREFNQKYNKK